MTPQEVKDLIMKDNILQAFIGRAVSATIPREGGWCGQLSYHEDAGGYSVGHQNGGRPGGFPHEFIPGNISALKIEYNGRDARLYITLGVW